MEVGQQINQVIDLLRTMTLLVPVVPITLRRPLQILLQTLLFMDQALRQAASPVTTGTPLTSTTLAKANPAMLWLAGPVAL
jgi:hypothetical protein